MQKQALLKQKPGAIAQHPARQRPKTRRATTKKSISTILKKSQYWPLTLLGHCVQFFGVSAVAGALIGAAVVYGYAFFRPLPFISVAGQSSTVHLHGTVRGLENKPMKDEFYVGVLASQLGPVQNSDGSFVLEVPKSNAYDVALWNGGTVKVFHGFEADPDGSGYKLQQSLPFIPKTVASVAAQNSRTEENAGDMRAGNP
jgi:hypothetical protein